MRKLLIILLCLPMIGFGQTNTLGSNMVNPDAEIKEVFSDGEGVLLEGPTMGPDGNVEFKGILVDLMNNSPDGIKVDLEGNIYVAVKGNIFVYSPKRGTVRRD